MVYQHGTFLSPHKVNMKTPAQPCDANAVRQYQDTAAWNPAGISPSRWLLVLVPALSPYSGPPFTHGRPRASGFKSLGGLSGVY